MDHNRHLTFIALGFGCTAVGSMLFGILIMMLPYILGTVPAYEAQLGIVLSVATVFVLFVASLAAAKIYYKRKDMS